MHTSHAGISYVTHSAAVAAAAIHGTVTIHTLNLFNTRGFRYINRTWIHFASSSDGLLERAVRRLDQRLVISASVSHPYAQGSDLSRTYSNVTYHVPTAERANVIGRARDASMPLLLLLCCGFRVCDKQKTPGPTYSRRHGAHRTACSSMQRHANAVHMPRKCRVTEPQVEWRKHN